MRKIPEGATVPAEIGVDMKHKKTKDGDIPLITQERKYELITPLFGGGVEPNKNDDLTPISGKAIRGHLRFWWRATRGGRFNGDLQKMKEAEAAIWGAASTIDKPNVSSVKLTVSTIQAGNPQHVFEVVPKLDRNGRPELDDRGERKKRLNPLENIAPAYAAFPLQPSAEEMQIGFKSVPVGVGMKFALHLDYPEEITMKTGSEIVLENEIDSALWAWETFGGLGARTRRGFGALHCYEVISNGVRNPPVTVFASEKEFAGYIRTTLEKCVGTGKFPSYVPFVSDDIAFEITNVRTTAIATWKHLVSELREFRQQRNPPPPRSNRPGRSKWCEPEQIREITGQRLPRHGKDANLAAIEKFPRAAFGLPINFTFNPSDYDKRNPFNQYKDPRKTMLMLEDSDRLSSPLILRPIKIAPNKFVGIALILNGSLLPKDMKLALKNAERSNQNLVKNGLSAELSASEALLIKDSNNANCLLGKETDVLLAFLDFLQY